MKRFNEMNEQDIINTLRVIAEKYNISYSTVGYSKEGLNNNMIVILNNSQLGNNEDLCNLIWNVFVGFNDIDGNEISEKPNYDELECPYILVGYKNEEAEDCLRRWVKKVERRGEITWLQV